jgi:D-methionine transport system ATP-binding protein
VEEVFLHPASDTARRFVGEVEDAAETALPAGVLVRLTFKGEATYKPVLGAVARETGVDYSILGGRIHKLRDAPYGQLTLALTGGDVEAAIARFEAADVRVDRLEASSKEVGR